MRHSDVAYVLAKLRVRGEDFALVHAHRKWGDWSLVGGHVEPTDRTWDAAAAREVEEEMAPLRCGEDIEVERLADLPPSEWGPVPSRSASNRPTTYRAEWFVLRFKVDPRDLLARLPHHDFRLVRLADLPDIPNLSGVIERAAEQLPRGWQSLPLSWDADLDSMPLEHLSPSRAPAPRSAEGC